MQSPVCNAQYAASCEQCVVPAAWWYVAGQLSPNRHHWPNPPLHTQPRPLMTKLLLKQILANKCSAHKLFGNYPSYEYLEHSCLKWPLEEIYNLIFEHLTYSAILVPNWNTWQKYFSWTHFSTDMIETFWGGKEDASLARNDFLGCQETLELLEKG